MTESDTIGYQRLGGSCYLHILGEISNRFAALESLDESFDINGAWKSIRENNEISARENLGYQKLNNNKLLFDDECSKLIDQRKRAKL
jgi:hypothetical protein